MCSWRQSTAAAMQQVENPCAHHKLQGPGFEPAPTGRPPSGGCVASARPTVQQQQQQQRRLPDLQSPRLQPSAMQSGGQALTSCAIHQAFALHVDKHGGPAASHCHQTCHCTWLVAMAGHAGNCSACTRPPRHRGHLDVCKACKNKVSQTACCQQRIPAMPPTLLPVTVALGFGHGGRS